MEDAKKWFKEAKFGMMVHWGLYSLLAGEYGGKRTERIGEWIRNHLRIPREDYMKLAKAFNPVFFNAEEIVLLAKEAGMKYIVVTSKHHEGFCLFKSEYDDFNVVDGTPFGRDIIAEFSEACKKHGMKLGLYYSQFLDWQEENGGGWKKKNGEPNTWSNDWDFPDNDKKDFNKCLHTKIITQVREILTKYGELALLWFDIPSHITYEQSKELFELVKSIQPNCLVNTRLGNGFADFRSMGDNEIADEYMEDILVETPATLNDTWGFKYFDQNWKSADEVLRLKKHLNDRGVNYLLNIGPDHLGRIPVPSQQILREVGKRLREEESNA